MLNPAEHEIFSANKYENANNICSAMFSMKELTIISNLRFISKTNFMLSWVEHETSFITSGPDQSSHLRSLIRTFIERILDSQGFKVSTYG